MLAVIKFAAAGHLLADRVGDPAGVSHRRVDHVRRDPEGRQLQGRAHGVVRLGRLGGSVGDFLREAGIPAGSEPDDAALTGAASDMTPRELADQQRRSHRVHPELLLQVAAVTG
jgi:hypothetical protein